MHTETTSLTALRDRIRAAHHCNEHDAIARLLALASFPADARQRIETRAQGLIEQIRTAHANRGMLEAYLHEYDLSSHEGIALMCMAEALLRIPDTITVDHLIQDKIGTTDWRQHLPHSDKLFMHASTWGLLLTGRIMRPESDGTSLAHARKNLLMRASEPLIRQALRAAMRLLGGQFIMGRNITEALEQSRPEASRGYRHSYDMLGEAALSMADANRYRAAYEKAILAAGATVTHDQPITHAPGISIKLSALHPRYEVAQKSRVMTELLPSVLDLAIHARTQGLGLTLDAEESDRLELSLDLFEAMSQAPALAGWNGLGLAVQAYQKRAPAVLDWLADMAHRSMRRIPVRLVKGAYWDTEIKLAQERGLIDYPVYTKKLATDITYLACARRMLDDPVAFYPQFATHNALSVASLIEMTARYETNDFEFQRLHGMGVELYDPLIQQHPCRVYAPVGSHEDLLAYLVRRLLENGANSSFVHRIEDGHTAMAMLIADPVDRWRSTCLTPASSVPLPQAIYGTERMNSRGLDLSDLPTLNHLQVALTRSRNQKPLAAPARESRAPRMPVFSPAHRDEWVGEVIGADAASIEYALTHARRAQPAWDATPARDRAACLERAAEHIERDYADLIALIVREAGRTLPDAMNEVREAIDFCRYYAARARADFGVPRTLAGPTGEQNLLSLHGRGVFACISPWNFPLAIFIGQVSAALAAGNAVIAKPAGQTPLIAAAAVQRLHAAGIPRSLLHLLPGDGQVGAALVTDPRISGVAFTGSTETARKIARILASRAPENHAAPLIPLIAETGGINVMIADSSTLPEQLIRDVISSAFNSAGQRCSALRVLFIQSDIADKALCLLAGAMQELEVGDPSLIATDIGPVIDEAARAALNAHVATLEAQGRLIYRCELAATHPEGNYFAPQAWEIPSSSLLQREVFGPILHVIRWQSHELDKVIHAVNDSGYGLTLGIHTRIDTTANHIIQAVRVGNIYVNRNMIGAVVGVQPFGGEGLSGTGPKAGGPNYLQRFATERCLTINTAAAGGNVSLMSTNTPS